MDAVAVPLRVQPVTMKAPKPMTWYVVLLPVPETLS